MGDLFTIKQTINKVAEKLGVGKINISEFNDENFDGRNIVNACNQFSFFNEKRLVVVYPPEKDVAVIDKQLFLDYINNPNLDCYLLIINLDNKFDFIKDIERIECKPSDVNVAKLIKNELEKQGKQIDGVLINKLQTYCKGNINRIIIEIKKICDYLHNETIVKDEIIEKLVPKDTELKVFDLTTFMGQKNIEKAHKVLFDMLKAGEPPIKILGLISNHFRRVFFAKINKGSNAELAKELGCKEYAIVKAKEESVKMTAKQLKDIQKLILEADYSIKSGEMTQENVLYYLLMKICLI